MHDIRRRHREAHYRGVTEDRARSVLNSDTGLRERVVVAVRRMRPRTGAPSLKAFAAAAGMRKRGGRWCAS